MANTQGLVEIQNEFLAGAIFGSLLTVLAVTQFGSKVRSKAQGSLERKLGL